MAVAAVAIGADALIIEMHPRPEEAMSDGYQSLTPDQFKDTIGRCHVIADAIGKQI